jgi:hypothetical protein
MLSMETRLRLQLLCHHSPLLLISFGPTRLLWGGIGEKPGGQPWLPFGDFPEDPGFFNVILEHTVSAEP